MVNLHALGWQFTLLRDEIKSVCLYVVADEEEGLSSLEELDLDPGLLVLLKNQHFLSSPGKPELLNYFRKNSHQTEV